MFRELKAKKAKFGFEYGTVGFKDAIPLADFVRSLEKQFPQDSYFHDESGYHPEVLKFYTNDEHVAAWIRNYKPVAS